MKVGLFENIIGFEWDKFNKDKNFLKHSVANGECEEVFFDDDKKLFKDALHSRLEKRYIFIGKTKRKRLLFIVFTVRNNFIRIISARDLNKKERRLYEKTTQNPKI